MSSQNGDRSSLTSLLRHRLLDKMRMPHEQPDLSTEAIIIKAYSKKIHVYKDIDFVVNAEANKGSESIEKFGLLQMMLTPSIQAMQSIRSDHLTVATCYIREAAKDIAARSRDESLKLLAINSIRLTSQIFEHIVDQKGILFALHSINLGKSKINTPLLLDHEFLVETFLLHGPDQLRNAFYADAPGLNAHRLTLTALSQLKSGELSALEAIDLISRSLPRSLDDQGAIRAIASAIHRGTEGDLPIEEFECKELNLFLTQILPRFILRMEKSEFNPLITLLYVHLKHQFKCDKKINVENEDILLSLHQAIRESGIAQVSGLGFLEEDRRCFQAAEHISEFFCKESAPALYDRIAKVYISDVSNPNLKLRPMNVLISESGSHQAIKAMIPPFAESVGRSLMPLLSNTSMSRRLNDYPGAMIFITDYLSKKGTPDHEKMSLVLKTRDPKIRQVLLEAFDIDHAEYHRLNNYDIREQLTTSLGI